MLVDVNGLDRPVFLFLLQIILNELLHLGQILVNNQLDGRQEQIERLLNVSDLLVVAIRL